MGSICLLSTKVVGGSGETGEPTHTSRGARGVTDASEHAAIPSVCSGPSSLWMCQAERRHQRSCSYCDEVWSPAEGAPQSVEHLSEAQAHPFCTQNSGLNCLPRRQEEQQLDSRACIPNAMCGHQQPLCPEELMILIKVSLSSQNCGVPCERLKNSVECSSRK